MCLTLQLCDLKDPSDSYWTAVMTQTGIFITLLNKHLGLLGWKNKVFSKVLPRGFYASFQTADPHSESNPTSCNTACKISSSQTLSAHLEFKKSRQSKVQSSFGTENKDRHKPYSSKLKLSSTKSCWGGWCLETAMYQPLYQQPSVKSTLFFALRHLCDLVAYSSSF